MENGIPNRKPAFFSGDAQSLEGKLITGQIYPFIDDLNKILFPHFASTEFEQLFVGNFVDRVNNFNLNHWKPTFWNPKKLNTANEEFSIYCTLGWLISKLEKMLSLTNITKENKYYLILYMDMHLPLMIYMENENKFSNTYLLTDVGDKAPIERFSPCVENVFHEGKLPDVLHYIIDCSFFSDNRQKTNPNPIVHLLSKALPQRCTIRNLIQILSKYCRKYKDVYDFILGCMKCSLLGLYKDSLVRPDYKTRMRIMKKLNETSKAVMLQWMMKNHQQLLFYIIKEFLVFGVRKIPSIYEEINQRYYWDKFESCVKEAMNIIRKFENKSGDILEFRNIEQKLLSINKQQVHHLFRPKRHSFENVIITECEKHDDNKCIDYVNKAFPVEYTEMLYSFAIRIPLEIDLPIHWLEYFNVSKNTIKKLKTIQEIYNQEGSKSNLKNLLSNINRYEFEAIRQFSIVFNRKKNVRVFLLPSHIYKQQYVALKRKYNIPKHKTLGKDVGKTYFCFHCKQFKGFVNGFNTKGKRVNLYAYGHSKVLIEDEDMKLYCGKRCDKVDAKKRHNNLQEYSSFINIDNDERQKMNLYREKKREAKEKKKNIRNQICAETELCSINLLGVVLQFFDNMYTICPICANFMQFDSKYFTENGFYCGCCIEHGKLYTEINCEWCKVNRGNETWSPILVNEHGKNKNIYLCTNCYKPWIRNSTGILDIEVIKRGLLNKWKRIQHPST
tara:strand:- start:651 stop:2834 length:2184 start_codon:yes stop_codon:yes gene_type:complete